VEAQPGMVLSVNIKEISTQRLKPRLIRKRIRPE
jgi:hypothetical protein